MKWKIYNFLQIFELLPFSKVFKIFRRFMQNTFKTECFECASKLHKFLLPHFSNLTELCVLLLGTNKCSKISSQIELAKELLCELQVVACVDYFDSLALRFGSHLGGAKYAFDVVGGT
jgi:hypothetical protein